MNGYSAGHTVQTLVQDAESKIRSINHLIEVTDTLARDVVSLCEPREQGNPSTSASTERFVAARPMIAEAKKATNDTLEAAADAVSAMQQCCQVLHTLASGTPEQRASVSQGTVGSRRERGDLERLLERLKGDEGT